MADVRVVLNVGGRRFETFRRTLLTIRNTRLSRLARTIKLTPYENTEKLNETDEYFFDRNAVIFESILDFYRTGELHVPQQMCGEAIHRELEFWDITDSNVATCCSIPLNAGKDAIAWNKRMKSKFLPKGPEWYKKKPEHVTSNWRKIQYMAWQAIENPFTSIPAMINGIVFATMTLLKVMITVFATTSTFRVQSSQDEGYKAFVYNSTSNPKERMYYTSVMHPIMTYIEIGIISYFVVELTMRFLLYPCKKMFLRNFVNVLDLCILISAILAFVALRIFEHRDKDWRPNLDEYIHNLTPAFLLLGMVTVLRVLRILIIVYQLPLMKVLILSLFESRHVLYLMVAIMVIGTMIYAPLVYVADFMSDTSFTNIPLACWWAIVTMTTVGYGDQTPKTVAGYIVGSFCAITGIVLTALPIAVIGNNFNKLHAFAQANEMQLSRARSFRRRFTIHSATSSRPAVRASSSVSV